MGAMPRSLMRHRVTVEPRTGSGAYGDVYGPQRTVRGFVTEDTKVDRRTSGSAGLSEGEEFVSVAQIRCRLDEDIPVGSRVTLPSGKPTRAAIVRRRDGGGLPTPDHLEVVCE